MKRFINCTLIAAIIVSIIDWGIIGVKLLNNEYDFTVYVYIGLICFAIILIYAFYYNITQNKCPHCGKVRMSNGKYCSYCGKEI